MSLEAGHEVGLLLDAASGHGPLVFDLEQHACRLLLIFTFGVIKLHFAIVVRVRRVNRLLLRLHTLIPVVPAQGRNPDDTIGTVLS